MASSDWIFCNCCGFKCDASFATDGRLNYGVGNIEFPQKVFPHDFTGTGTGTGGIETGTGTGTESCATGTGIGEDDLTPDCDYRDCAAGTLQMIFQTAESAKTFLGTGNYVKSGGQWFSKSGDAGPDYEHDYLLLKSEDGTLTRPAGSGLGVEVKYLDAVYFCHTYTADTRDNFVGYLVPYQITIGSFVWRRRNNTPVHTRIPFFNPFTGRTDYNYTWGDFDVWDLVETGGVKFTSTGGKAPCFTVNVATFATSFVFPADDIPGFRVAVNSHEGNIATCDPCPGADGELCLRYVGGGIKIDGYILGGNWTGADNSLLGTGTGTGSGTNQNPPCRNYEPSTLCGATAICRSSSLTLIPMHFLTHDLFSVGTGTGTGTTDPLCHLGTLNWSAIQEGVYLVVAETWTMQCPGGDLTESPSVSDWHYVYSTTGVPATNECGGRLVTFDTANCASGNETQDSGPPPECPTQYCKYQWDGDSHWNLIESNCISPSVCPSTPTTPPGPSDPWIQYLCCVSTVPSCSGGKLLCDPSSTCNWVWNSFLADWIASACADDPGTGNTCVCEGKPGRSGLFNGETVAGYCCNTGSGGGGPPP